MLWPLPTANRAKARPAWRPMLRQGFTAPRSNLCIMPHTWSNVFDVRATPAGARGWGPGIWPTRTWACGPSPDAASPPPKSVRAAETRRLVATRHGAVLVLLPEGADHDDILAALQDAHTRIQREIHADRQRRAA
ncbi:MAG: hypothetical protein DCC68_21000 [Planctomycetota bacterium]|nr:MAG: hypothetical protein DCC68_21000 [Planctomycetota bacterium]